MIARLENEPELTIDQAADIMGVARRTIYNWIETGKLRYRRTAGGSIRIYRASLFQDDGGSAGAVNR